MQEMVIKLMLSATIAIVLIGIARNITSKNTSIYNWAKNITCKPIQIFHPTTKKELASIVKKAYNNNQKIRAMGSHHSWSPIVCTDYLVNTEKLNKILSIDQNTQEVTVEAGIKIYELNKKLQAVDLALPNQSFTQSQSLAGVIATATHGTGKTGTFASFITGLELIMHDGSVKKITKKDNPEEFAAISVSFGCFGIIYSVTLSCINAFEVTFVQRHMDIETMRQQYKKLIKKHDFFQFT